MTESELIEYNAIILSAELNGFPKTAKRMREIIAKRLADSSHGRCRCYDRGGDCDWCTEYYSQLEAA